MHLVRTFTASFTKICLELLSAHLRQHFPCGSLLFSLSNLEFCMQIFAARVSVECNTKMYLCVSELRGARPVRQYCRIARWVGVQEGWYPDSAGAEYWRHRGLVAVFTAGETGQASATVLLPPRVLLVLCCLLNAGYFPPVSFYSPSCIYRPPPLPFDVLRQYSD